MSGIVSEAIGFKGQGRRLVAHVIDVAHLRIRGRRPAAHVQVAVVEFVTGGDGTAPTDVIAHDGVWVHT